MRTIRPWTWVSLLVMGLGTGSLAWGEVKPTIAVEDFFRALESQDYTAAAALLSSADHQKFEALKKEAGPKVKTGFDLPAAIADQFFLLHGQGNRPMLTKAQAGEVIMPVKVQFFVPGQHYLVGNFAVVFTRETYEIKPQETGPVRDDPRKLWVDPTNVLSKLRDEPYFKQYWEWTGDQLTMPGLIWLIKEKNQWKIDLFSGVVPKQAFQKVLHWHFRRNVLEEVPPAKAK